jgi:hypothetical protein
MSTSRQALEFAIPSAPNAAVAASLFFKHNTEIHEFSDPASDDITSAFQALVATLVTGTFRYERTNFSRYEELQFLFERRAGMYKLAGPSPVVELLKSAYHDSLTVGIPVQTVNKLLVARGYSEVPARLVLLVTPESVSFAGRQLWRLGASG